MNSTVTGEQVVGFQIPYKVKLDVLNVSSGPDEYPVQISEPKMIFIEEPPLKPRRRRKKQ